MKVLHVEAGMHLYGGALQVCFLMRGLRERGVANVLACPQGSAIAQEAAALAHVVTLPMGGDRMAARRERPGRSAHAFAFASGAAGAPASAPSSLRSNTSERTPM